MTRRAAYGLHSPEVAAWYREMAFASACSMRIASIAEIAALERMILCLSVLHADCIATVSALRPRIFSFVSACSVRIASVLRVELPPCNGLCLSVLHADCIYLKKNQNGRMMSLSQRAPCGLHRQCAVSTRCADSLPQRAPCGLHRRQHACDD